MSLRAGIIGSILCMVFASNLLAAEPPSAAAPRTETLVTCLATAADGTPIGVADTFAGPTQLVAVLHIEHGKSLHFQWIAVDLGAAAPAGQVINEGNMSVAAQQGMIALDHGGDVLPPGKYRLSVTVDSAPWRTVDCTVTPPAPVPALKSPQELLPLVLDKTWNYDLREVLEKGATSDLPDVRPSSDGILRGNFALTVGETSGAGTCIARHSNGTLLDNEWWRLDNNGLSLTQRTIGDKVTPVDPPQRLWPLPLANCKEPVRMWGPVPVAGLHGATPGFIVLQEASGPDGKTTVERDFVIGVGMTREVTITVGDNGGIKTRELVLRKMD
jgi:hypothetical protein